MAKMFCLALSTLVVLQVHAAKESSGFVGARSQLANTLFVYINKGGQQFLTGAQDLITTKGIPVDLRDAGGNTILQSVLSMDLPSDLITEDPKQWGRVKEVVTFLLKNGAHKNSVNDQGQSVLDLAQKFGAQSYIVQTLSKVGARRGYELVATTNPDAFKRHVVEPEGVIVMTPAGGRVEDLPDEEKPYRTQADINRAKLFADEQAKLQHKKK